MFFGGVEREHQVEDLFVDGFGTAVRFVDLVYHYDRLLAECQGLLQYETRLWHRSLECVDKQQYAVAHVQYAFDLAAEVGVSRGVDDIDLVILVDDRYVFRKYRDATFAFEVVVVEDQFAGFGVVAQQVSGHDHLVDQCRFAVVDVRDDGDIAKFLHNLSLFSGCKDNFFCRRM